MWDFRSLPLLERVAVWRRMPAGERPPLFALDLRHPNLWLLAFGVVLAAAANGALHHQAPTVLVCQRLQDLTLGIRSLDHGGPPLVSRGFAGGWIPIGYTDDVGPYLYLSYLGHFLHTDDALRLHQLLFVGLMSLALALTPLLWAKVLDSVLAGILAPLLVLALVILGSPVTNEYWAAGWAGIVCVPLLALALRRSGARRAALLVSAAVTAGFAESLRSGSGYGIVLVALAIGLFTASSWWRKLSLLAAVAIAFWAVDTQPASIARSVTDARIGNRPLDPSFGYSAHTVSSALAGHHIIWHQIYIGLGFEPNRYGIGYNDSYGINYFKTVDPRGAVYGPEYSKVLRQRVMHFVTHDPGFVLGELGAKLRVASTDDLSHSPLLLIVLPIALLFGVRCRTMRQLLLISLPPLLVQIGLLTVTAPVAQYELSLLMLTRMLFALALACIAIPVLPALARLRRRRERNLAWVALGRRTRRIAPGLGAYGLGTAGWSAARGRRPPAVSRAGSTAWRRLGATLRALTRPRRRLLVTVALIAQLVALLTVGGAAAGNRNAQLRIALEPPGSPSSLVAAGPKRSWSLAGGIPPDWIVSPGVQTVPKIRSGSSILTTTSQQFGYQLSADLSLPAGSYELFVRGQVLRGGINLLAHDSRGLIAESSYNAQSTFGPGRGMIVTFDLSRPDDVMLTLANDQLSPGASTWSLSSVSIGANAYRTPPAPAGRCPSVDALAAATGIPARPQYAPPLSSGAVISAWSFSRRPSSGWERTPGTRIAPLPSGDLDVLTSKQQYAYQFTSRKLLDLAPGRYALTVSGNVEGGGMALVVVGADKGGLISVARIGEDLPGAGRQDPTATFTLRSAASVQLALANNSSAPNVRSHWTISRVELRRIGSAPAA